MTRNLLRRRPCRSTEVPCLVGPAYRIVSVNMFLDLYAGGATFAAVQNDARSPVNGVDALEQWTGPGTYGWAAWSGAIQ